MVNIMNKLLLAGTALLTIAAGSAYAADMSPRYSKAPPMVAAYNWTGCYIGGTVGGDYGTSKSTATSGTFATQDTTPQFNISGTVGGGKIGCNYEFGGMWVIGLEGDDTWTNNKGNSQDIGPFPTNLATTTTQTWIATQRGRIGYAWDAPKDGSTGLVFLTGGAAETNIGVQVCNIGIACSSVSGTKSGYTVGGGLEIPIYRSNWIFTFDYLYVNFGTEAFSAVTLAGTAAPSQNTKVIENIIRVGLDYKFDWGGPVVARY
jgi:outer membrane immunogenic protein